MTSTTPYEMPPADRADAGPSSNLDEGCALPAPVDLSGFTVEQIKAELQRRPSWCEGCEKGTCGAGGIHESARWPVNSTDMKIVELVITSEDEPHYEPPRIIVSIFSVDDPDGEPLAFAYFDGAGAQTLGEWADAMGSVVAPPEDTE